jgi:hypothetical protein
MHEGWICVFTTNYAHLAELVHAHLLANDLQAVVLNKRDSSYLAFGGVEVYVPSTDRLTAEALILSLNL